MLPLRLTAYLFGKTAFTKLAILPVNPSLDGIRLISRNQMFFTKKQIFLHPQPKNAP